VPLDVLIKNESLLQGQASPDKTESEGF
jgi:hypothetical protein